MKPTVFIHTNHIQLFGARVSAYSLQRASRHTDSFDIKFIELKDFPNLAGRDGKTFLRDGKRVKYQIEELQSFTLLRFLPPQLMDFQSRAVVIDPDVFAVGDIYELLTRDMKGKSVLCRKAESDKDYGTSVMLLDNSRLQHWKWDQQISDLFAEKRDYKEWIKLRYEPEEAIGLLEEEWNDYDHLTENTKLLHNTARLTQPWRTGLLFKNLQRVYQESPLKKIERGFKSMLGSKDNRQMRYEQGVPHEPHPDKNQQDLFFALLAEMVQNGLVSRAELQSEIDEGHLRTDTFDLLETTKFPAIAQRETSSV
jgi:hypothetical protein